MDTLELSKYKYIYKVIVNTDAETDKYNIYKYPIVYISKEFVYYPEHEHGELIKIHNEHTNDLHSEFICIKGATSRSLFGKEHTYYYISYKKVDREQIKEAISQIINKISIEERNIEIENLEKRIKDLKSQIDMLSADLKKQKEDMVKMKHTENIKLVEEFMRELQQGTK